MSNLGAYQAITTIAKRVGGPKRPLAIIAVGGYAVIRPGEAAAKKAIDAVRKTSVPCATKGQVFRVTAAGSESELALHIGDEYRVLERDGDAILIEVLGDSNNPHFVSSVLLRSVSDYPPDDSEST